MPRGRPPKSVAAKADTELAKDLEKTKLELTEEKNQVAQLVELVQSERERAQAALRDKKELQATIKELTANIDTLRAKVKSEQAKVEYKTLTLPDVFKTVLGACVTGTIASPKPDNIAKANLTTISKQSLWYAEAIMEQFAESEKLVEFFNQGVDK